MTRKSTTRSSCRSMHPFGSSRTPIMASSQKRRYEGKRPAHGWNGARDETVFGALRRMSAQVVMFFLAGQAFCA